MDSSQDNRGPELVAIMAVFLVVTWIAVALRFFVRIKITKSFQADDWFMATSLIIFTLYGSFVFAGVHYGMGRHDNSLPPDQEIQALKYQALATASYIANMAFIKLSIALFLLRIAVERSYQIILKSSIVIVAVWTAGIFLFDIFECKPVAFQWDYTIQGGTCVPGDSLVSAAYAFSVLSVLSDWLYALLPIPMLWKVQMNIQTKIIVIIILSLGVFASIATLIRIKYLIDLADAGDLLFASTDTMIWTIIEPGLGITAASIVTLRPLLRALKIRGFTSSDNNAGQYQNQRSRSTNNNNDNYDNYDNNNILRDSEPLGGAASSQHSHSHKLDFVRTSSVVMMTKTSASAAGSKDCGKKKNNNNNGSPSVRTYEGGDNESQEIILFPE